MPRLYVSPPGLWVPASAGTTPRMCQRLRLTAHISAAPPASVPCRNRAKGVAFDDPGRRQRLRDGLLDMGEAHRAAGQEHGIDVGRDNRACARQILMRAPMRSVSCLYGDEIGPADAGGEPGATHSSGCRRGACRTAQSWRPRPPSPAYGTSVPSTTRTSRSSRSGSWRFLPDLADIAITRGSYMRLMFDQVARSWK